MKLIHKIMLRMSLVMLPLIAIWTAVFYFKMMEAINDETDDALEDYSDRIITGMLAGQPLPSPNEGSNNSYSIMPVSKEYADSHSHISYKDADIFISEKKETEPSRILTSIFRDKNDIYYELNVCMPTFERDDLLETVLTWSVALSLFLLLAILILAVLTSYRTMKPLYELLHWLNNYLPGKKQQMISNNNNIQEFKALNSAIQGMANRSDELYQRQSRFIGNASHELQTPLAVLRNRLDWMADEMNLNEKQMEEVFSMKKTLSHIIHLNKTLLLLTKIENKQIVDSEPLNLITIIKEQQEVFSEIYEDKNITCEISLPSEFYVCMNPSLAAILVSNLIKNAYLHSEQGASVHISLKKKTFVVANQGIAPLDSESIFERFYVGSKKEGSTGLGLSLVKAITDIYGIEINYSFNSGLHRFQLAWK